MWIVKKRARMILINVSAGEGDKQNLCVLCYTARAPTSVGLEFWPVNNGPNLGESQSA